MPTTIIRRRVQTVQALQEAGFALEIVNGGGTGSLETTRSDPSVTDIAAGSGLYAPVLFDGFRGFRAAPAMYFALPVVRHPAPGIVTCSFGGYNASGTADARRAPVPTLPPGLSLLEHEAAGEVQTPLRLPRGLALPIGSPVFFRHAKAGELTERFERLLLVRGETVVSEVPTYRGEQQCFF